MNVSNGFHINQYSGSLSPLRAANRQPELALQLIKSTMQGIQEIGMAKISSDPASAPPPHLPVIRLSI